MKVEYEGRHEEGHRIPFEPVDEPWTKCRLPDGTIIRMKLVVADVIRLQREDSLGEPVYVIESSNVVAIEPSDGSQDIRRGGSP